MALAGTGAADEHGVALLLDEGAAGEISHQALVGGGAGREVGGAEGVQARGRIIGHLA
jgi:hypothetical protein